MNNIKQKIVSGVTTAAIVFGVFAGSAYADTSITVSGNGAFSDNHTNVSSSNSTTVSQNNTTSVNNNITNTANTGGVNAGFNTGGNVTIQTGNATANTSVQVDGGSNTAQVSGCCGGDTDVTVSGNGAFSDTSIRANADNSTHVSQNNTTSVNNAIANKASTGNVSASYNTGGDVRVTTGNANATTRVQVSGGENTLHLTGNGSGTTEIGVSGNGAFSNNRVSVNSEKNTRVNQNNRTEVNNTISNSANTGGVSSNFNTGGNVDIHTGDANAHVDVRVNGSSNVLDMDGCGCGRSTQVWISGNGAFSNNGVYVNNNHSTNIRQNNHTSTNNTIHNLANSAGFTVPSGYYGGMLENHKSGHGYDNDHRYNKMDFDKISSTYDSKPLYHDYDRDHHDYKKYHDYGMNQRQRDYHDADITYSLRDTFKDAWRNWYMDNYTPNNFFQGEYGFFVGFNTGGDVTVYTGDATANTTAVTTGNSNELQV